MQTLADIRRLLDERGLSPRKALGQNFLIDQNLVRRLVEASGVGEADTVLEIGPGTGVLSEAILERGCRLVACELDPGLAGLLRDRLGSNARFTLVEADCLESKHSLDPAIPAALGAGAFSLVANLPYGAGTPVMATLMADHPSCRAMFVTIQREVADRLIAAPGTEGYGALSVLAQASGTLRRIASLGPECFWPRPDVASTMIGWRREDRGIDLRRLDAACRRVFSSRRKQLGSILGRGAAWPPGIEPTSRAEDLTPDQLVALSLKIV